MPRAWKRAERSQPWRGSPVVDVPARVAAVVEHRFVIRAKADDMAGASL